MPSPDFNPIEKAFSRLKTMLRKARERTVRGLWTSSAGSPTSSSQASAPIPSDHAAMDRNERKPLWAKTRALVYREPAECLAQALTPRKDEKRGRAATT